MSVKHHGVVSATSRFARCEIASLSNCWQIASVIRLYDITWLWHIPEYGAGGRWKVKSVQISLFCGYLGCSPCKIFFYLDIVGLKKSRDKSSPYVWSSSFEVFLSTFCCKQLCRYLREIGISLIRYCQNFIIFPLIIIIQLKLDTTDKRK